MRTTLAKYYNGKTDDDACKLKIATVEAESYITSLLNTIKETTDVEPSDVIMCIRLSKNGIPYIRAYERCSMKPLIVSDIPNNCKSVSITFRETAQVPDYICVDDEE